MRVVTTEERIDEIKLHLLILKTEIQGYLDGEWSPEYYMTIGYNKFYTGRKRYPT